MRAKKCIENTMDKKERKETLLVQGQELLKCVHHKDMGYGITHEVLDDEHLRQLNEWLQRAEEFMEINGLKCQCKRFHNSLWIICGDRIHVERIQALLDIIKSVKV